MRRTRRDALRTGSVLVTSMAAVVLGLLVALAPPALAHAELVASAPAGGARLTAPPTELVLRFTEPVTLVRDGLRLLDATGRPAGTGEPRRAGREVRLPVLPGLADGAYVLAWRVVSADSHPVAGAVPFVIGEGDLAAATDLAETSTAGSPLLTRAVFTGVRWAAFLGLVLLVGTVAFSLLCWPAGATDRSVRRLIRIGAAMLAAATVGGLLLQGVYTTRRPLLDVVDPVLLVETLGTPYGIWAAVRLMLVAAIAGTLPYVFGRRPSAAVPGLLPLGLLLLLTFAASGHAVAATNRSLAIASDVVHLAAMCVWLGGLVVLAVRLLPSTDVAPLVPVLPRFSRVAFTSVCALALTGAYQAWREVGSQNALTGTAYGRVLLAKLALVAALLALGNLGRVWVRRHLTRPVVYAHAEAVQVQTPADGLRAADVRRLRRSVTGEVVLAGLVLGITAALVAIPPGRTASDRAPSTAVAPTPAPGPVAATLELPDGNRVRLAVDPARAGANTVELHVTTAAGRGLAAEEVRAAASLPERGIERLPVTLHSLGPGHYAAHGAQLPFAGDWRFAVTVRTSETDASVAEAVVAIR